MNIEDIWINPFYMNSHHSISSIDEKPNPADYVEVIHSHCEIDTGRFIDICIERGEVYIKANKELILDYYRKLFPKYARFRDDTCDFYIAGHPLCSYAEKNSPVYCITLYGEGSTELQASIIIKAPIEGIMYTWYYDPHYGDEWNEHDYLVHITPINLAKDSELSHFQTKHSSKCQVSFIGYKYYRNFYKDIIENHNESGSVSIEWLVKDGEYVSEQQTIAKLECNRQAINKHVFDIKCFCGGIIFIDLKRCIFGRNRFDFPGPSFYTIYKGYSDVIKSRFKNYSEKDIDPCILVYDSYRVEPWIVNGRYYYNDDGVEIDRFKAFEMCSSSGISLFISFIVKDSNPMIVFSTDDTKLSFKSGDVISLLMKKDLVDRGTILYFTLEEEYFPYPSSFYNLYNQSYSSTLFEEDLDVLTKYNCYNWKFINSEKTNVYIGGNYNSWCSQEYAPESFKDYAQEFKSQINYVDDIVLIHKYLFIGRKNECQVGLLNNKENAGYKVTHITDEIAAILKRDKEKIRIVCLKEFPSIDIALGMVRTLHDTFFETCDEGMWKSLCLSDLEDIKTILDGYIDRTWLDSINP